MEKITKDMFDSREETRNSQHTSEALFRELIVGGASSREPGGPTNTTETTDVSKKTPPGPSASLKPGLGEHVDRAELEAAVESIQEATKWTFTTGGTDEDKFQAALTGKTVRQRQIMDEIYRIKYGKSIEQEARDEMSGHDLEKTLALLSRSDKAGNAGTTRIALVERSQFFAGRADSECERIVRDVLETMTSVEIAEADSEYRLRYGSGLGEAIRNHQHLSAPSKAVCEIYLKGREKRSGIDCVELAKIACTTGDVTMLQEATRQAPQEARAWFATADGRELLKKSFEGHWYNALTFGLSGNVTDDALQHAVDYAVKGKLSVSTQVKDNTGWLGDNEQFIELSLRRMTEAERNDYVAGKAAALRSPSARTLLSDIQLSQLNYYQEVSSALRNAAGKFWSSDSQVAEMARWEDIIESRGGSANCRA